MHPVTQVAPSPRWHRAALHRQANHNVPKIKPLLTFDLTDAERVVATVEQALSSTPIHR